METVLFIVAADIVVTSAITNYQIKARETIVKRWKEGSLNTAELLWLRKQQWFQKTYIKTPKEKVSSDKKNS